jgi:hypothetical protein
LVREKKLGLKADLSVYDEGETTCCYAEAKKAWVQDPAGLAWETYRIWEMQSFLIPSPNPKLRMNRPVVSLMAPKQAAVDNQGEKQLLALGLELFWSPPFRTTFQP